MTIARKLRRIVEKLLFKLITKHKFGRILYYSLISNSFYREINAVYSGKKAYEDDLKNNFGSEFLLRRNTHRLEKGMLMRPMKEVFALDYIQETVDTYNILKNDQQNTDNNTATIQWAADVLHQYFKTVGKHPIVNNAKSNFYKSPKDGIAPEEIKKIPYKRLHKQIVSYESFYELCLHRRSVRWFLDKQVPKELILKALEAAKYSPSACNRQPFTFRIFDDKNLAKQIGAIPGGTKGFSQNFPAIAVVVGDLSAYPFERDRHVIYIDGALASMSFMFALETLEISSCPINWPDVEAFEKKMERVLELKPYERPIMLIAFGYPDPEGLVAFSDKKSVDQIAVFNKLNTNHL